MNKTKYFDELLGIYLYTLELQEDKYYVGITHNPKERIRKHKTSKSNAFVKQNLPVKNYKIELLETTDRKEAFTIETQLTIDFINHFGIENVAGGRIVGDLRRRKRIYNKELKKMALNTHVIKSKSKLQQYVKNYENSGKEF